MAKQDLEYLISVDEAARRLGVTRQTAYRYCRQGKLPFVWVAGKQAVDERDLAKVVVQPQGFLKAGADPAQHMWTRAMTAKRLDEWNRLVQDGQLRPETQAEWEEVLGFTHAELCVATDWYYGKE